MKRLNIGISDEADEKVIEIKKKMKFSNRDETVDFIIRKHDSKKQ